MAHPIDLQRRSRVVWAALGWFITPLVWLLHLASGYAVAGWVCANDARWLLHGMTLAALLIVVVVLAGLWADRYTPHAAGNVTSAPVRFLQTGGWLLSLLFAALIVAQSLPVLLLRECL